jgi:hypothetical protein
MPKFLIAAILVAALGVAGFAVAWQDGYVSRAVVATSSPDGSVEAVCRARLPESTEYDLWLRERGAIFGRRVELVGTESMGRCREVVWSPRGEYVAVLNEGGLLSVFDGRHGKAVASRWLVQPRGSYPMEQVVTHVRFESADVVSFAHCARLWNATRRSEDLSRCASDPIGGKVALGLR